MKIENLDRVTALKADRDNFIEFAERISADITGKLTVDVKHGDSTLHVAAPYKQALVNGLMDVVVQIDAELSRLGVTT